MAQVAYYATGLTGGATTALDYIDGAALADGDFAFVFVSDVLYTYILDDDSGAAESSPDIISPDTNAGDKRWILQPYLSSSATRKGLVELATDAEVIAGSDTGRAVTPAGLFAGLAAGGATGVLLLSEVVQAATDTLTAAEVSGTLISNYGQAGANTQTLPAAAKGYNGIVHIATAGAGAFNLKAGAGDKIYLDGTALDDGDKVSLAAPAVGDHFSFWSFQTGAGAYDWIVSSGIGTLTDGGA